MIVVKLLLFLLVLPLQSCFYSGSGDFSFKNSIREWKTSLVSNIHKSRIFSSSDMEFGVLLDVLTNHGEDGNYLKDSIIDWLGKVSLVNLENNRLIGEEVGNIYVHCRNNNITDLTELMLHTGTKLQNLEITKDKDLYVSSWEIVNKMSDLLLLRMNRELCACSAETINTTQFPYVERQYLEAMLRRFSDNFNRYVFLQGILQDNASWEDIRLAVALILGYRVKSDDEINGFVMLERDSSLMPIGWENDALLSEMSEEFIRTNVNFGAKMDKDLPKDGITVESVLDGLIGAWGLENLQKSKYPDTARRLLLVSWLFVHGFLGSVFPHKERFIPGHQLLEIQKIQEAEE